MDTFTAIMYPLIQQFKFTAMAKSDRKRIVIEIPHDNFRYQRIYNHVSGSDSAKKKILDVYDIHYYPRSLVEDGADSLKVLIAATASANQLYSELQELVALLHSAGIQAPPAMLAQAGIIHSTSSISSPPIIEPRINIDSSPSEIDDDDDWGEIIPLTPSELEMIKKSQIESGLISND